MTDSTVFVVCFLKYPPPHLGMLNSKVKRSGLEQSMTDLTKGCSRVLVSSESLEEYRNGGLSEGIQYAAAL